MATFRGKDTTYTANVDSMGHFSITFSLDSATYLDFFNGPERTAMYVYPGDNIFYLLIQNYLMKLYPMREVQPLPI